ncbi:MAG: 16S rRNA (cytidine(1402)-2'-O)-methyltransferase [Silicimonas sp.]|nr:16S rRNA (cytidine(1402)-2'-O)-methyltransferase [Silicimonas sp.]
MSKPKNDAGLDPGLYFVATPLGNARDITLRALDVLRAADVLAAEDTRTLRHLMEIHGIDLRGRRIVAYHDHSKDRDRAALISGLEKGLSVAYASEAGTPLIADPGFALGRAAIEAGHKVWPVPGPSAVLAALTASGLPTDRFTFAGFPPSAIGARRKFLEGLSGVPGTLVLYESPRRLGATLDAASETLGPDRDAAICRELTKKFEEVRRGTLDALADFYRDMAPKGEIVLCIGEGQTVVDPVELEAALRNAMKTQRLKDAAREVADQFGVSRRELYQMGLGFDQ